MRIPSPHHTPAGNQLVSVRKVLLIIYSMYPGLLSGEDSATPTRSRERDNAPEEHTAVLCSVSLVHLFGIYYLDLLLFYLIL